MTQHNFERDLRCALLRMSFSKCSPHSSPSCLVLKSPEHQPIRATAPHPLCLFLNLASSLLLALPLGCLSCSSQDLCPESSSKTPWLVLPPQLSSGAASPQQVGDITQPLDPPGLPATADTLPALASPAFTSCLLSLMKRNNFCPFPRLCADPAVLPCSKAGAVSHSYIPCGMCMSTCTAVPLPSRVQKQLEVF